MFSKCEKTGTKPKGEKGDKGDDGKPGSSKAFY